ncbi:2-amino-4-hydroxy-6-hydroxymethyldihydropteridine pyrophosphokinase [Sulfurifustis variabilis]|uniref:2-amino-4-hydroxy-6-hydroxymethyldihydropteridine pyrophosphokinase n=1 Tax=Sulfurifustis variabilis TaxID=1675686 RepID=A0A1B4VC41_9GAMM|nr:2-amino-4-hydroxy-6-hydroxymethyldihydropteridine diphosphokinase [Sulfurifustis variabilis]BAU48681.1 2-amino-4-hydroxy-6-hydroxymethyldihydropteridine pyrophosphokinase [Sulfurifustis variabilis]
MKQVRAYIGIGSNMDDPERQARTGTADLRTLPHTTLVRCSSLYRSAPVGPVAQPDFVNAVCSVDTGLSSERLLAGLLEIERKHGRDRGSGRKGGPRTLDLDLLLYGDERRDDAVLALPHPRLHERAFVLYPLSEIAPGLVVPGRGAVEELLRACADQRVSRVQGPTVPPS